MWGLFSKDPTKDFPFDSVEQVGQLHLANKSVWTLHKGKNRATQEPVSIFSCDAKDGASATQLDVARYVGVKLLGQSCLYNCLIPEQQ